MLDYDVPLTIGQVRINPGDIIFADCDGVLCVPRTKEEAVIMAALEKVRGESTVRKALQEGMSTVEAFETYGIM